MVDCTTIYNCDDCIAQQGCGWCSPANCVPGSTFGPNQGSCDVYKFKSCVFSRGMIGGIIATFVTFGVLLMAMVILVFWCKCKRAPKDDKPISTRDLGLEEEGAKPRKFANSTAPPENPKHALTDARRKAMEEKYKTSFSTRS